MIYLLKHDINTITDTFARYGSTAVSMLDQVTDKDTGAHPDTYAAGYMQGYAHGIDLCCHLIAHADEMPD